MIGMLNESQFQSLWWVWFPTRLVPYVYIVFYSACSDEILEKDVVQCQPCPNICTVPHKVATAWKFSLGFNRVELKLIKSHFSAYQHAARIYTPLCTRSVNWFLIVFWSRWLWWIHWVSSHVWLTLTSKVCLVKNEFSANVL